jgi:hypothetical protein
MVRFMGAHLLPFVAANVPSGHIAEQPLLTQDWQGKTLCRSFFLEFNALRVLTRYGSHTYLSHFNFDLENIVTPFKPVRCMTKSNHLRHSAHESPLFRSFKSTPLFLGSLYDICGPGTLQSGPGGELRDPHVRFIFG